MSNNKQSVMDRLIDSEEYAGEEAVPQIAYDAMEELQHLQQSISENMLRAAFLLEGVHSVGYNACIKAYSDIGGCVEMVHGITAYGPKITDLCDQAAAAGFEYPGVLDYEVTNAIGSRIAECLIANGDFPPEDVSNTWIQFEVHQFFGQGLSRDEKRALHHVIYGVEDCKEVAIPMLTA